MTTFQVHVQAQQHFRRIGYTGRVTYGIRLLAGWIALTIAPPVHAVDGVAEINQTYAIQTG